MSDALVERLSKIDTCALSDAMDRIGLKGVAYGIKPQWPGPRICGRVVTVRLVAARPGQASSRHLCTEAIMVSNPGDVIVVENHARYDAAGWGGILSNGAQVRGVAGVIVDGAARDIDESRDLQFPVYARSGIPSTARGRIIEDSTNVPVTIDGVSVHPGDIVLADWSGVVFVPADRAEEIIKTAEDIAAREALMTKDVRAGKPITEVMGINYEQMLHK